MDSLERLQERLVALHPGYFQPDDYLRSWITEDIGSLLLTHGELMEPRRVQFGMGRHLDCCRSCLEYAMSHPDAIPYFGMALSRSFTTPEHFVWWVHNWNMLPDGTLIDSEPEAPLPVPPLYIGVKWGAELWNLIPKREGADTSPADLPPIFTRHVLSTV